MQLGFGEQGVNYGEDSRQESDEDADQGVEMPCETTSDAFPACAFAFSSPGVLMPRTMPRDERLRRSTKAPSGRRAKRNTKR